MSSLAYRLAVLLTLLVVAGACAPALDSHSDDAGAVTLSVQNNNWLDVNVYVIRGGREIRLGTVMSAASKTFSLRLSHLDSASTLRLVANPIGTDRGHASQPIIVNPGQRVEWRLENQLALSSYRVH